MLKKTLTTLLIFSFFSGFGQGVKFENSLKEAFKRAKTENKILFIEYYSPTCPYCQQIAPFFKEKVMGDLHNTHFINYQLDVNSQEGFDFHDATNLDVFGIPYFLFFKPDSTLVHAREVSANINSVLQPGQMMAAKQFTGQYYGQRFDQGERSENFLSHYALFSRVKRDYEANKKALNTLWESYSDTQKDSRNSWVMAKKTSMGGDNGFVEYWIKNINKAKEYEADSDPDYIENVFTRILSNTVEYPGSDRFSPEKWQSIRESYSSLLGENTVWGMMGHLEVKSFMKAGEVGKALKLGQDVARKQILDSGGLVYLSKIYNDNCRDAQCLKAIQGWLNSARPLLTDEYGKAAYYLESARLQKNKGNTEAAGIEILKAKENAQKARLPLEVYDRFLKSL